MVSFSYMELDGAFFFFSTHLTFLLLNWVSAQLELTYELLLTSQIVLFPPSKMKNFEKNQCDSHCYL